MRPVADSLDLSTVEALRVAVILLSRRQDDAQQVLNHQQTQIADLRETQAALGANVTTLMANSGTWWEKLWDRADTTAGRAASSKRWYVWFLTAVLVMAGLAGYYVRREVRDYIGRLARGEAQQAVQQEVAPLRDSVNTNAARLDSLATRVDTVAAPDTMRQVEPPEPEL